MTRIEILRLNEQTTRLNGGNYVPPENILNASPLDYLIEIVSSELFGQEAYPEIWDKAGLYMFNIICNHVFSDGNKRTGLAAALFFLAHNGFTLKEELVAAPVLDLQETDHDKHLEVFTLTVASGDASLEQVQNWFKMNITNR